MISPTYTGQIYGNQTTTATESTSAAESGMGQDAFLKMFMAQLTSQNPLDPMDNTEFTAQLATFSQLEQLTNISKSLEGLERMEEAVNLSSILSYLGKEVSMSGNLLPVTQGYVGGFTYNLESDADVVATITDENGGILGQMDLGRQAAGSHKLQWDGMDYNGEMVADGVYNISITATGRDDEAVSVTDQVVTGLVTGYQKDEDGNQYLLLGQVALPLSEVLSVNYVPATSTAQQTSNTDTSDTTETSTSTPSADDADSILNDILEGLSSLGGLAALLL